MPRLACTRTGLSDLKRFTRHGPDLTYDFFTRAQVLHALLTGDAAPRRLAFRWLQDAGVRPASLVHDLQNHDEITYQIAEFEHRRGEALPLPGCRVTGQELKERVLEEMRPKAAGPLFPAIPSGSRTRCGAASPPALPPPARCRRR
jgi:hypothetical protein